MYELEGNADIICIDFGEAFVLGGRRYWESEVFIVVDERVLVGDLLEAWV